jgi:dienelactone hydrolase
VVASALRFVRSHSRDGATVATVAARFPVIVLSPGNATNVDFYASFAEDLASHGYVVVGLDHPYQVTAVSLSDSRVAVYVPGEGRAPERIAERVVDVSFALDQLARLDASTSALAGRLDLERIGIMGHSNGGMTAAEACKQDARLDGCLNIDGQLAGGPLAVSSAGRAPEQPFMYLTKEVFIHPVIEQRFEDAGPRTYRVVVPAAAHGQFVDTGLFVPTANPFDRTAATVIDVSRGFSLAFFDHVLRDRPTDVFRQVRADTDVYVNVYPLRGKPALPHR